MILEAELGKLDIKIPKPGILLISLQVNSLFKLAIMTSCRFNVLDDVIQKEQRHDNLIKAHAVR